MNRTLQTAALLAAALTMSCGLIGKEFTLPRTVSVHASETDPVCQVDKLTFNLADDQAFNDLKGVISRVELRKVKVTVTDPMTDPTSVATRGAGTLRVGASTTATELVLGTWADVPITAGSGEDIVYDQPAADEVINLALHPPNTFYVESNGCVDAVPAWFDFKVEFTLWAGM